MVDVIMTLIWNEIRPIDYYHVQLTSSLSLFQIKTLTHLYQPLIGSNAYSLYLTLLSEVDGERHISVEKNHQWLMNVMSSTLDQIYRARLRLEALGLVKSYVVSKSEEHTFFEYELNPPLTPEQFFGDDILSICLYNQIGTHRYKDLRARYSAFYSSSTEEAKSEKKEITKEFHEVFTTFHPSELVALNGTEIQRELHRIEKEFPLPDPVNKEAWEPEYKRFAIDIDVLKGLLLKGLKHESILSPDNMTHIKKIAYFYQLDEWNLSRLLHDSLTVQDELDLALLREKAKEWYRLHEGGKPPRVIHMVQPISQRVVSEKEAQTDEDKHLYTLENISPLKLLEAYQGGGKVAEADVKLVEELLFDYQLYPSVVNLLIEYIYLTNDFKLPRYLVTKVAAHWKRLKINDIKQAQELAKKEHQQYKQWKEKSKDETSAKGKSSSYQKTNTQKQSYQKTNVRKDILPPWIEEQAKRESEGIPNESPPVSTITEQQREERIKSLLQALGEWDEKEKGDE
jgi:replication initiation and membrane attachment protein